MIQVSWNLQLFTIDYWDGVEPELSCNAIRIRRLNI